jgi:hypothetical protein
MNMSVPTAFAVAWMIPTRWVPRSDSAHSAHPASAVGTAATTPRLTRRVAARRVPSSGKQIEELGHEPGAERHVGEDAVERDAGCIPMEEAADPPVGNDLAGQWLDSAYDGVKTVRPL